MGTFISMSIKNKERLDHGNHNEQVCEYLQLNKEYSDWVITTAFYSALQFVKYKIFPFKMPAIEGRQTAIEDLDDWILYQKYNAQKSTDRHKILADLVEKHCKSIYPDYDWLLDMSKNARYNDYRHDPLIAQKAINLMKAIKKHCI